MLTCACLCVCVYMHIHRCTYIHLSVYMWVYMYMLYTLTSVFLLNTSYWISPTKRVLLTFLLNFLECLNNFIFSSNDMKFSLHPILIFSAILKNISFERLQEKLSPLLFWIFEIQIKLAFFPELIKTYVLENGWKWMKRNSETKNYLHLVYWIYQNTILFFFLNFTIVLSAWTSSNNGKCVHCFHHCWFSTFPNIWQIQFPFSGDT